MAKRFGMTVEEVKQLTPEQIKAKNKELRQKRMAEKKAMMEATAAEPVPVPTPEAAK